jgi:hypothetical protein
MKEDHYTIWADSKLVSKTNSHTRDDFDDMLDKAFCLSSDSDSVIQIYSSRDDLVWDSEDEYMADVPEREDHFRNDVEADADTLASAGYGTDEDYGCYGEDSWDNYDC